MGVVLPFVSAEESSTISPSDTSDNDPLLARFLSMGFSIFSVPLLVGALGCFLGLPRLVAVVFAVALDMIEDG